MPRAACLDKGVAARADGLDHAAAALHGALHIISDQRRQAFLAEFSARTALNDVLLCLNIVKAAERFYDSAAEFHQPAASSVDGSVEGSVGSVGGVVGCVGGSVGAGPSETSSTTMVSFGTCVLAFSL